MLGVRTQVHLILYGRHHVVRTRRPHRLDARHAHVRITARRDRLSFHRRTISRQTRAQLGRHDAFQVVFDGDPIDDHNADVGRSEPELPSIAMPIVLQHAVGRRRANDKWPLPPRRRIVALASNAQQTTLAFDAPRFGANALHQRLRSALLVDSPPGGR